MARPEVNHRSPPPSSAHPHLLADTNPPLLQTPQTPHLHSMQAGLQVPFQNPHTNQLDSMQPMQFPPQPTHSMPQNQQANAAYHAQPPPPSYHLQSTNFQPSPAPVQYVPVHQTHTTMVVPLQQTASVVMVPPVSRVRNVGTVPWTTGLFDCMDDPTNALITCCVPCVTFGQVAEIVDNGHTSCGTSALVYGAIACLIGCPFLVSCTYRTKLRSIFDLVESPAPDWFIHFLCDCCALCQEYRELQNRGFDPSIGYHANVARHMQQQQVAMVAPANQTMIG